MWRTVSRIGLVEAYSNREIQSSTCGSGDCTHCCSRGWCCCINFGLSVGTMWLGKSTWLSAVSRRLNNSFNFSNQFVVKLCKMMSNDIHMIVWLSWRMSPQRIASSDTTHIPKRLRFDRWLIRTEKDSSERFGQWLHRVYVYRRLRKRKAWKRRHTGDGDLSNIEVCHFFKTFCTKLQLRA